jgi:hypothetical protein
MKNAGRVVPPSERSEYVSSTKTFFQFQAPIFVFISFRFSLSSNIQYRTKQTKLAIV